MMKPCAQRKTFWISKRLICSLSFLAGFAFLLRTQGSIVQTLEDQASIPDERKADPAIISPVTAVPSGPYDILVNSYMRSGSSYTGRTIGLAADTFYIYEPLLYTHKWEFLKGPSSLCNYYTPNCSQSKNTSQKSFNSTTMYLGDFFGCHLRPHIHRISKFIVSQSGSRWKGYKQCLKAGRTEDDCVQVAEESCRNATHRAAKVLRMTVDNLEPLLLRHKKLKIIHLLRDPRGIMRSHVMTDWYPVRAHRPATVEADALTLCQRMEYDLKAGKRLQELYPGRFRFVQYEDIVKGKNMAEMMKFLDLYRNKVHSGLANQTGYDAFSYRNNLPYNIVQQVDTHCAKVYAELGLRKFANKEEYLNKSVDAVLDELPFRFG